MVENKPAINHRELRIKLLHLWATGRKKVNIVFAGQGVSNETDKDLSTTKSAEKNPC